MLVKYAHDKKEVWDDFLDACIHAYNTSVHESTSFSPFELMFGRKALLPIEIDVDLLDQCNDETDNPGQVQAITDQRLQNLETARENIRRAQEKEKQAYDRKHASPNAYVVGEKVLKKDFRRKKRAGGKMDTRYVGPYVITKCVGKGLYYLSDVASNGMVQKVSGAYLKPYKLQSHSTENQASTDLNGEVS